MNATFEINMSTAIYDLFSEGNPDMEAKILDDRISTESERISNSTNLESCTKKRHMGRAMRRVKTRHAHNRHAHKRIVALREALGYMPCIPEHQAKWRINHECYNALDKKMVVDKGLKKEMNMLRKLYIGDDSVAKEESISTDDIPAFYEPQLGDQMEGTDYDFLENLDEEMEETDYGCLADLDDEWDWDDIYFEDEQLETQRMAEEIAKIPTFRLAEFLYNRGIFAYELHNLRLKFLDEELQMESNT